MLDPRRVARADVEDLYWPGCHLVWQPVDENVRRRGVACHFTATTVPFTRFTVSPRVVTDLALDIEWPERNLA